MPFSLIPFPLAVAQRARAERRDDFGHALVPVRADAPGSFPCRVCLRDAEVGEELLLLSHRASAADHPHSVVGPVFVHVRDCSPWPEPQGLPPVVRSRLVAARAYDAGGDLVGCDLADGREVETLIDQLLENPAAAAVHLHFARAGCFACRLERA